MHRGDLPRVPLIRSWLLLDKGTALQGTPVANRVPLHFILYKAVRFILWKCNSDHAISYFKILSWSLIALGWNILGLISFKIWTFACISTDTLSHSAHKRFLISSQNTPCSPMTWCLLPWLEMAIVVRAIIEVDIRK
jgi:hypothetical protein